MKKLVTMLLLLAFLMILFTVSFAATYPEGTLYRGVKGHKEQVEFLQYQLFYGGYLGDDIAEVDGVFGKKTEEAVKAFQKAKRLPVTGVVDAATQALLDEDWENGMESQGGEKDPYPCCYQDHYANGTVYTVLCHKHMALYEQAATALADVQAGDAQTIAALQGNIQLWLNQLDEQYALQTNLANEECKAIWQSHKAAFLNYYAAQMALNNVRYGMDSMAALEQACTILADHSVEMCYAYGNMP